MPYRSVFAALLVGALVLSAVASRRGAEYDEQYTLFLTAGSARPVWPTEAFTAGQVRALQAQHAGFAAIARDLRATDVHPPLYFWLVSIWRRLAGNSLFAARLASVLFSVAGLGFVALAAQVACIPPATAVLLTLGCYGFTYVGAIARGFALAQLLTLAGLTLLLIAQRRASKPRALVGGLLMGAATFANYLAVFVACAALFWQMLPTPGVGAGEPQRSRWECVTPLSLSACIGFAVWLPADLWFFLAQRQSRTGQFAPFDATSSVMRLAHYAAANLFGGLPLYVGGIASPVVSTALTALLVALIAIIVWQWHHIATPSARRLLTMAALAPLIGLLLLGLVFNNTPIELRYLTFCTPFVGLLLAGAFAPLPRYLCCAVLVIQLASIIGLMTRPETMQPARATATAAVALVRNGVVLLPRGNDGVGIVGAFAIESPPATRLLVIGRDQSPAQIRARASRFPRVVLALLGQDADSRATLPAMQQAFADPCWRMAGERFNVLAFDRICGGE